MLSASVPASIKEDSPQRYKMRPYAPDDVQTDKRLHPYWAILAASDSGCTIDPWKAERPPMMGPAGTGGLTLLRW